MERRIQARVQHKIMTDEKPLQAFRDVVQDRYKSMKIISYNLGIAIHGVILLIGHEAMNANHPLYLYCG